MGKGWNAATFVAIVVAATGVVGCGGTDNSSTTSSASTSTPGEFRQEVTAICSRVADDVARLGSPRDQSVEASRAWAATRAELQDAGLRSLSAVQAPEADTATFDALRGLLSERRDTMHAAQVKMVTGDPDVRSEFANYETQQAELDRLTAELNVAACNWR